MPSSTPSEPFPSRCPRQFGPLPTRIPSTVPRYANFVSPGSYLAYCIRTHAVGSDALSPLPYDSVGSCIAVRLISLKTSGFLSTYDHRFLQPDPAPPIHSPLHEHCSALCRAQSTICAVAGRVRTINCACSQFSLSTAVGTNPPEIKNHTMDVLDVSYFPIPHFDFVVHHIPLIPS